MDGQFICITIPDDHLEAVQNTLRASKMILTNGTNSDDPYDVFKYLSSRVDVVAHLDRNLVSHVLSLLVGKGERSGERESAAACIAFLGLINASFDPTMALHELGSNAGHSDAVAEHQQFFEAINIPNDAYSGYLVQSHENLLEFRDPHYVQKDIQIPDGEFKKSLRNWDASYLSFLKIADLHQSNLQPHEKVIRLGRWMVEDSIFNPFTLIAAILGFAPNPPKGILSGFQTKDKTKLARVIRRAAWDMTYIRRWNSACQTAKPDQLILLCSLDVGLRRAAGSIVRFEGPELRVSELTDLFDDFWRNINEELVTKIGDMEKEIKSQDRERLVAERRATMGVAISELEAKLGIDKL